MAVQARSLTYADLLRIRETRDERLELVDGELFVTPSPSPLHQYVSGRLEFLFRQLVLRLGYGLLFSAPLDVQLAEDTVVRPDLILYLPDRRPEVTTTAVVGAPSLVIEIVSPSTTAYDRVTKRGAYGKYGVPEYWLVDFEAWTVTVFSDPSDGRYQRVTEYDDTAVSATIPRLSIDLADLFATVPSF